jgi:hypothetical protein
MQDFESRDDEQLDQRWLSDDDYARLPRPDDEDEPRWTLQRVIFLLLIALTLLAFIAYVLFSSGLLVPPPPTPPPPTLPLQRI